MEWLKKNLVMTRLIGFILLYFALPGLVLAQQDRFDYRKSTHSAIEKAATVDVGSIQEDWQPVLEHMEMPVPGHEDYEQHLMYLKQQLQDPDKYKDEKERTSDNKKDTASTPIQVRGFEGNKYNFGIPNDNDLAISNDSLLVSVINSSMYIFDIDKDTLVKDISLAAFTDTLNLGQNKYDPKVKYDPQEDRFVFVCLNGSTDSTSNIIVAFSTTNDPTGAWNLYALDGNPFQSGHWSDYPMIALSEDELFVTVNLIETGKSWQKGFYQSLVWQIDKQEGYNGQSLSSVTYDNITFGGDTIRNLRPVKGGSSLYSNDGIYLLSNRNFAMTNDTIFLLEVTGGIADPSAQVTVDMLQVTPSYGLAPDGKQAYGGDLQTNDSRILGAFFENDTIQYVQTTRSQQTGRASVYHGIIGDVTNDPTFMAGHIITEDTLDFGYPNISYSGLKPGDGEAIINFLHTDSTTKPGSSAVFYNGKGEYSKRITVKKGESFTDLLGNISSSKERWGDYTGSQLLYNSRGTIWIAGSYGKVATNQPLDPRASATWLAELVNPDTSEPVTSAQHPAGASLSEKDIRMMTYPNPASKTVTLKFTSAKTQTLKIRIFNTNGRLVKSLLTSKVKKGDNHFSFTTEPLASGTYLLVVEGKEGRIETKKFSVVDK